MTPPNNNFNGQDKYRNFRREIQLVREYLSNKVATATMVAVALNIYRPNLCRYKAMLEEAGQLCVVRLGICKETGFRAQYLTTNPDLIASMKGDGHG